MPTTVINTVGSGVGRDYATITSWEAQNLNLTLLDQIEVAELYNDSTFVESITISGWTVDATRYIRVEAATGNEHRLVRGAGVLISSADATDITRVMINTAVTVQFIRFTGFSLGECTLTVTTATGRILACLIASVSGTCDRIFMYDLNGVISSTGSVTIRGCTLAGANTIRNCVAIDFIFSGAGSGAGIVRGIGDATSSNTEKTIQNCTVLGIGALNSPADSRGISMGGTGTPICQNCLSFVSSGVSAFVDDSGVATLNSNTSSDTTATGTGAVINAISSNYFVNVISGSENPLLISTSPAINTGIDLSANFTVDGMNTTRPQGIAWDRGAHEFIAVIAGARRKIYGTLADGRVKGLVA